MRPNPIALERFGEIPAGEPTAMGNELTGTDTGHELARTASAEPAIVEPATDPVADRLACLERIAGALELVAAEQAALRTRCISDAAEALGAAAQRLLPTLARTGFADSLAETTASVARGGRWPDLRLAVSPGDEADVRQALAAARAAPVRIEVDPALAPGEAELTWQEGGAALDVAALTSSATEIFRHRLQAAAASGIPGAPDHEGAALP